MALSKDNAIVAGYQLVRGAAPAASTYLDLSQQYAINGEAAIVAQIQGATASLTNAQLASLVVTNAGFTGRADLVQYVADVFGIFGAAARGQVVLNLAEKLLSFTNDATYGAAARSFSNVVSSNIVYAQNANNQADRPTGATTLPSTFTLTPNGDFADVAGAFRNATAGNSGTPVDFRFTSGAEVVNGTTATIAAGDSLIDGTTTDNDVLNVAVTGNTATGTLTNIETLNFTTTGSTAASTITFNSVTGAKLINVSGTAAGNITLVGTAIGDTGVTTIDASGLTTNVGIVVSSATALATAALTIKGATGADAITGGLGADSIDGGAGADTLIGGAGADTINGGAGNDFIQGGNDADTLNGDAGNDNIDAGNGADIIRGGAGNDIIVTGSGNDTVFGGAGNDTIALGTATLAANTTADAIATGATAALLVAGATATAPAGSVTVNLEADLATNGADVIVGFNTGAVVGTADVLNVSAFLGKAVTNFVRILSGNGADNVTGSNVVVISNDTLANAQADAAGNTGVVFGANAKTVVVEFVETTAAGADDNAVVRYVTTDANGAIVSNDVVATLVGVAADADNSIAGFVASNFA